jgi:putative flippase GtrA
MGSIPFIQKREVGGFLIAGFVGLGVDAGSFLVFFHSMSLGHYAARVLAFVIAVTVTWLLNRTFTFQAPRPDHLHREYLAYVTTQSFGVLVNFSVFTFCIISSDMLRQYPVFALLIGSGIAMLINFVLMKMVVFRSARSEKSN